MQTTQTPPITTRGRAQPAEPPALPTATRITALSHVDKVTPVSHPPSPQPSLSRPKPRRRQQMYEALRRHQQERRPPEFSQPEPAPWKPLG